MDDKIGIFVCDGKKQHCMKESLPPICFLCLEFDWGRPHLSRKIENPFVGLANAWCNRFENGIDQLVAGFYMVLSEVLFPPLNHQLLLDIEEGIVNIWLMFMYFRHRCPLFRG
jgi:hypothetical protein